jgi:hypothetical protein
MTWVDEATGASVAVGISTFRAPRSELARRLPTLMSDVSVAAYR